MCCGTMAGAGRGGVPYAFRGCCSQKSNLVYLQAVRSAAPTFNPFLSIAPSTFVSAGLVRRPDLILPGCGCR